MTRPGLAIVIPVWNLPEDLAALLGQVADIGLFSEVIIADDNSDLDCSPQALGFDEGRLGARLVHLRSAVQRGAGHMRNLGLEAVTAPNVLFFDADDRLEPGLRVVWAQHLAAALDGVPPDFTIFRHADSRVRAPRGSEGASFPADERIWDRVTADRSCSELGKWGRAHLAGISAYPWNKIYRTDFLRQHAIRCSETPVHNDIKLHWLSFAHATRVQAVRGIGATHVVGDRGHHLTTRPGAIRLCLFDILDDVLSELRAIPDAQMIRRHFVHFMKTICDWTLDRADPALRDRFAASVARCYRSIDPAEFALYATWQPARAMQMTDFLLEGMKQ